MPYFCYMLECRDGSYYCGWTTDLEKRIQAHAAGKGARYTRSRLPVSLVYFEELNNRTEAMRREWELKQEDHESKQNLARSFNGDDRKQPDKKPPGG